MPPGSSLLFGASGNFGAAFFVRGWNREICGRFRTSMAESARYAVVEPVGFGSNNEICGRFRALAIRSRLPSTAYLAISASRCEKRPHFFGFSPTACAAVSDIQRNHERASRSGARGAACGLGRPERPTSWGRTPRSGLCATVGGVSSGSWHKSTDVQQKSIALGKEMPKCRIVAGRKGLSAPLWLRAICKTPGQNVVRHSCSPGRRQRILHNGSSVPAGAKICCTSAYLCHLEGMRKRGFGKGI